MILYSITIQYDNPVHKINSLHSTAIVGVTVNDDMKQAIGHFT